MLSTIIRKCVWLIITNGRQIKFHRTVIVEGNFPKNSRYPSVINSHHVRIGISNANNLSQIIASNTTKLPHAKTAGDDRNNSFPCLSHSLDNFRGRETVDDTKFKCLNFLGDNSKILNSINQCKISINPRA